MPRDYVPAPRVKLELYRRLGRLRTLNHLADFRQEMIDRFGPLPRPAENLLTEAEIRILAGAWKLDRIHVEAGEYVVLTYRDAKRIEALARRHPGQVRIVDGRKAYVPLGEDPVKTPEIAERCEFSCTREPCITFRFPLHSKKSVTNARLAAQYDERRL